MNDLKAKASTLVPTIQIGKGGIGQNVIDELKKQLKANEIVKVKILRSALENKSKKEIVDELEVLSGSKLVEVRGNTAVFLRKE